MASYDPQWPNQANFLIERLRTATGFVHRIDQIGSTSVPGLPAKDLIDIQVVVNDLAAALQSARSVRRAGFVHVEGDWYGTDGDGVQFREEVAVDADPGRPVNVNFRQLPDPVWKETLLFRDFLRSNAAERDRYAQMKQSLALQGVDVDRYSELKMPYIRDALMRADSRPV